jgi:hypothetical protein
MPKLSPEQRQEALRRFAAWLAAHPAWAWKHGQLWYKLDSNQLKAYWRIRRAMGKPFSSFTLNWARRTGKTFLLLLIAVEECIRHKGHRYNVAAATQESLRNFVWPALTLMFTDCPLALRPALNDNSGRLVFRRKRKEHESVIVLAGCNDSRSVERLRGPYSNGNIIEEMGAIPDKPGLRYIQTSILNPQLMTTNGWTLRATTPPKSAGHAAAHIVLMAEANGTYSHCTLYDNPRLTPEQIEAYLAADASALGMTAEEYKSSADFRREWLAIIETDPQFAVLPRFTSKQKEKTVCAESGAPVHWDGYVSADWGYSPDWTGILYARWEFGRARLRIVGERLIRRMGRDELVEAITADELAFFGAKRKPFLRVSDTGQGILLRDLALKHGLSFVETAKDNLRAAVLDTNVWIGDFTLEIDPSCKQLIAQMTAATWHKKGREFDRSEEFGHFDLVASLIYLVRNVIPNVNRIPDHYGVDRDNNVVNEKPNPTDEALRYVFGR